MKIKQMIIILFVLLSVIPMTLLGMGYMYYYNYKLEKVIENDLSNTVSTQMKAINNFLTERRADAEIIAGNRMVHSLLGDPADRELRSENIQILNDILGSRAASNRYIESATILDADFIVVSCSDPRHIGEKSSLQNIDSRYLTPSLTFTSVVETGREGSRARVIAAVQEIYDGEQLAGYMVLELNLAFFEEIRDSAKVYNNGTIYIIDGNEKMITAGDTVSARDNYVLSQDERSDYHRAWEERDKNSSSGILRYKARGDRYISFYSQFDEIDWLIISSVNIDEVLQIKKGYWDLALLIAAVLACLLAAVNYIVRLHLARPIRHMISKFETIERTGDYSLRMEKTGRNEIGIISASINSLLSSMEEYVRKEQQIKENLKVKAEHDPLTGLYNKEAFTGLLEKELLNAARKGTSVACVFLDIDNFKDFNTFHGHAGGDKVLMFIAEALRSQIGELACRQGGDEFTVCIPDAADRGRVRAMIEDLTATLHHGLRLEEKGGLVSVNCSIGIVFSGESITTAGQMIERSDEAMYEVKNREKNGCHIWNE